MVVYPDATAFRKQLQKAIGVLIKEHENWYLEELQGKKTKIIINLPGSVIEDKKKYAARVKELEAKGELIKTKKKFCTCSKCRWTSTGLGCVWCNPEKREELLKEKTHRKREAIARGGGSYQGCRAVRSLGKYEEET